MRIHIGIGQGLNFYVIRENLYSVSNTCYIEKSTNQEMFLWLTQYLLDHNKDPTIEHKWYEIGL